MNNEVEIRIENNEMLVSSRQIAEHFGKQHKDVLESIRNLTAENSATKFFHIAEYENRGKNYPMYLMNRDGFSLLVMGFTGKEALDWKLKYIQAFNDMETKLKQPKSVEDIMIYQLQEMKRIRLAAENAERMAAKANDDIQGIRDVVSLHNSDWRKGTTALINDIALKLGGYEQIRVVREESYKLLAERIPVALETRLTNKRRRMAEEGVCKSKRDKLTKLDIIADDPKILECYLAVVKDMAIKYGASLPIELVNDRNAVRA